MTINPTCHKRYTVQPTCFGYRVLDTQTGTHWQTNDPDPLTAQVMACKLNHARFYVRQIYRVRACKRRK